MPKIYCKLPVVTRVLFSIDRPANWDKMTQVDREDYFLQDESLAPVATVCAKCQKTHEIDYAIDPDACNGWDLEFQRSGG